MKLHYDILNKFQERYYHNLFTTAMLTKQVAIKDEPYWELRHNKLRYLLPINIQDEMPILITDTQRITVSKDVYHIVTRYKSCSFQSKKVYTFRQMVDMFGGLPHSQGDDLVLYTIIVLASYFTRVNVRICADAAFGKDSIINMLAALRPNIVNITPRSMAAVEYRLLNKILILNELTDLPEEDLKQMQRLLLTTGDFKNIYEKSTRGNKGVGTQDTYNINNLSLLIIYNPLQYYAEIGKEKKYFDSIFTRAVKDRFLPLKLEGKLDVQQFKLPDNVSTDQLLTEYEQFYKEIIYSIEWYANNWEQECSEKPFKAPDYTFTGRHILSFHRIQKFLKLYAMDEKEYIELCDTLYDRFKNYNDHLNYDRLVQFNNEEAVK